MYMYIHFVQIQMEGEGEREGIAVEESSDLVNNSVEVHNYTCRCLLFLSHTL